MATAVEYGLIAALVTVAGVTAVQALNIERPVDSNAFCTAAEVTEEGVVDLECGAQPEAARMKLVNDKIALAQALRPRPMSCKLYQRKEPECQLL